MINKKVLAIATLSIFTFSAFAYAGDSLKFGKEIKLKEKTNVSTVLEKPEQYLGKTILIEGKVTDVCKMRGCWMKLSSDQKKQNIVIKVNDGEMVFPLEARGKNAKIEGTLFKVESEETHKHEYEEKHNHDHKHSEAKEHKHDATAKKTIYMFKPTAISIE